MGVVVGERVSKNHDRVGGWIATGLEAAQGFVQIAVVQDAPQLALFGPFGDEKRIPILVESFSDLIHDGPVGFGPRVFRDFSATVEEM